MTLDDFVAKWDGQKLEITGAGTNGDALYQCVDLANGYIRDVLGLPIIEWTNAVDFPTKADPNHYDYIVNNPTDPNQIPTKGDLVVWKPSPGHIAVFLDKIDDNHFHSFDENFPLYSVCHIQEHNWTNVIGWLHPKPNDTIVIKKTDFENLVTKSGKYDDFVTAGFGSSGEVTTRIEALTADRDAKQKQIDLLNASVAACSDQNKDLLDQLAHIPVSDLANQVRPLVWSGWLTYLRSRSKIQTLVGKT